MTIINSWNKRNFAKHLSLEEALKEKLRKKKSGEVLMALVGRRRRA